MAEVVAMARPRIGGRFSNESRANWIQVDVPNEGEQISVGVNQEGVITALEQMAGRIHARLKCPCVTTCNAQDDLAKRNLGDLDQSVDVVGHPAVRMDLRTEVTDRFSDYSIQ